ncbi:hypothetical protein YC81_22865 [Salmonella enterica subsp. enterica serovar Enteritidis]|nr:hypothetical protein [Salmonella enterica subsp. enterica serovar Enteritidis]
MITKEQAVHLMGLADAVDDTSAVMAYTVARDLDEYRAASMAWTARYKELMAFIWSITETDV